MKIGKCGRGAKPKTNQEYFDNLKKKLDEICKGVAIGLTLTDACRAAGVDISTFYTWQNKAKVNPDYAFFNDKVDEARAQGERMLAGRITEHSKKDWRAAAWLLERRNNAVWGRKDVISLFQMERLRKDLEKVTDEELAQIVEAGDGDDGQV